jgi:predicted regulator of Ras-like GTPase activity (Roadblock/LC7/MglB family)
MADIEVPSPGASDIVGRLLSDALSEHPDVQWLGLVSEDGFAIASEGEVSVDDDAVAAGAVRMMIQVRSLSKALGQSGTSQLFLEGSESGICVIDKDPWVLVVVGAPGVPIGLLRYEAREIAEGFPMGQRRALTASPEADSGTDVDTDWSADTGYQDFGQAFSAHESADSDFLAAAGHSDAGLDFTESEQALDATQSPTAEPEDAPVTQPDGQSWFRWADEPTIPDADSAMLGEEPGDFSDWLTPTSDAPSDPGFDLPPPDAPMAFDATAAGTDDDLSDLAPPVGAPIDLPPPTGPVFDLPAPE